VRASDILERLEQLGSAEKAQVLQRFFKTGKGEYGEGDIFLGITVPVMRKLAGEYQALSSTETLQLLHSTIHEARLVALLILVCAFERGDDTQRKQVFDLYLANTAHVNNWDLVDLSAHRIVGPYLEGRDKSTLYALAQSRLLWDRRISVLATFYYIKRGEFGETLRVAELLLGDPEDLIHKAVGWMLREVGKRDRGVEEEFLRSHYTIMPRTMLRYAIEKFPEELRRRYLRGEMP